MQDNGSGYEAPKRADLATLLGLEDYPGATTSGGILQSGSATYRPALGAGGGDVLAALQAIAQAAVAKKPFRQIAEGVIMADLAREEIDAKIAASEARGDTKIARIEGKLDLVISKLDAGNTRTTDVLTEVREQGRATRSNTIVVGLGVLAVMIAIAALRPSVFDKSLGEFAAGRPQFQGGAAPTGGDSMKKRYGLA